MSVLPAGLLREHLSAPRVALRMLLRVGLAFLIFLAVDIHITQGIQNYVSDFLHPEPDQELVPALACKLVFSVAVFALFISRSLSIRLIGITNTFLCFWLFIAYEALNSSGSG